MNLEFMHSKWRDEAASHEQALVDVRAQAARIAHLEDEQRRYKEREGEANARVAAARSDALDRVQELQEMHLRHDSTVASLDSHKITHAQIKERLSVRLVRLFDGGIKKLCFSHWQRRLDDTRVKAQLMRALEKNWMSRRLLLWRHQRESANAQQLSDTVHYEREALEERMRELEEARDVAVARMTTAEVALSEARDGLQNTLLQHTDLVVHNENLATQLRAFKARASREDEMEAELKKARFELRVVEEELRLSQDLSQTVRMSEASAEVEASKREAMQARIDAACEQLAMEEVSAEERLDVLIVLAKRCWAAQRDRDTAMELRQSLARQVKAVVDDDVTAAAAAAVAAVVVVVIVVVRQSLARKVRCGFCLVVLLMRKRMRMRMGMRMRMRARMCLCLCWPCTHTRICICICVRIRIWICACAWIST